MHPYINTYTEEEEEVDISKNDFNDFIQWLINDGIKPRKSKRLWRKTILNNLLNNEKMTLDNFHDFVIDREEQNKKAMKKQNIDTFDYSILINKVVNTTNGKQIIKNYKIVDSMIHLFFEEGNDLLIPKSKIQESFGK